MIGPKPASVLAVSDAEISQHLGGLVRRPTLRDVDRFVAKRYGEQLNDPHSGKWNLEVAVHVRVAGRWAYMIPTCDCASLVSSSLDFLREMPELQSYGFWDNTDRPKGVSRREWERRESVWRAMLKPDHWGDVASLEIVTWIRFAEVSPVLDLAAEYRDRKPAEAHG